MLAAIVAELGQNWSLVSDTLSATVALKGVYRQPNHCKERHAALARNGENERHTPEEAAIAAVGLAKKVRTVSGCTSKRVLEMGYRFRFRVGRRLYRFGR